VRAYARAGRPARRRRRRPPRVDEYVELPPGLLLMHMPRHAGRGHVLPGFVGEVHAARVLNFDRNRSGNRGYRSNRSGPVPVPASFKLAQIQNSNLNLKNEKNSKNTLSCDESNGVNFFQIFVHLVYFTSIWS